MGSLGARQLNAASDLDLIVIYDPAGAEASAGPRPLAARPYYARLTQALVTALSAPTAAGRLYEVDMRLRPSGRQGPVATSIQSFRTYQMDEAWTWEHLALTRARVVGIIPGAVPAGADAALAARIEALRTEVLASRGQDARVMPDLADMRRRIFAAKPADGRWEAKVGRGRLQDIELFAQSLALRSGSGAHGVAAQLRAGQRAGLVAPGDARALADARRFLWQLQCGGRLLTDGRLDMDRLGRGGQDFLLRETGAATLEDLAGRLKRAVEAAGAIIDGAIGVAGETANGPAGGRA